MAEHDVHGSDTKPDAYAVARYLAGMTRQLESMALASKLALLGYLLAMARAEAESLTIKTRADSKLVPR